ncbi:MAG: hypothetical protein V3V84_00620 [Candidatus Bathyarchaeia archaeon]
MNKSNEKESKVRLNKYILECFLKDKEFSFSPTDFTGCKWKGYLNPEFGNPTLRVIAKDKNGDEFNLVFFLDKDNEIKDDGE